MADSSMVLTRHRAPVMSPSTSTPARRSLGSAGILTWRSVRRRGGPGQIAAVCKTAALDEKRRSLELRRLRLSSDRKRLRALPALRAGLLRLLLLALVQ